MKHIYIHIGYVKTGSTTLQNAVFKNHSQIYYLGKPFIDAFIEQEFFGNLLMSDTTRFNPDPLRNQINEYRSTQKHKTILLSEEDCLSFFTRDKGVLAKRLYDVLFPCKIIITLRNQIELVNSYFRHVGELYPFLKNPHQITFSAWMNLQYYGKRVHHFNTSFLASLYYFDIINYFINVFGRENVKVLLYEDFKYDPDQFLQELSQFLNIGEEETIDLAHNQPAHNVATRKLSLYRKIRSFLFPQTAFRRILPYGRQLEALKKNFLSKGRPYKEEIPQFWHEKICYLYQEGNTRLADKLQLPLDKYNYPLQS